MDKTRKFCFYQMKCSDVDGWVCGAHLAEAFVPICPFTEDDIDPEIDRPRRRRGRPGAGDGVCRDYVPYGEAIANKLRGR